MTKEILSAVWVSLSVTVTAVVLGSLIAIPIGYIIGTKEFAGKKLVCTIFYSLISIPTTVVGLMFYSLFSRRAIFGVLDLLYTPYIMIIGQAVLILPVLIGQTITFFSRLYENIKVTAHSLGINGTRLFSLLLHEFRENVAGIMMMGFGRAISEVGVSLMLGGNIRFYTRTITTSILSEVGKGKFLLCFSLGAILLLISVVVNFLTWKFVTRGK